MVANGKKNSQKNLIVVWPSLNIKNIFFQTPQSYLLINDKTDAKIFIVSWSQINNTNNLVFFDK